MTKTDYKHVASYEAVPGQVKKAVLLYSGGLDTSCILKWIKDHYKCEVVALTLDLGQQGENLDEIKAKALALGAVKAIVLDAREEFADKYLAKAIKANGSYQGDYYISTISRYLMAEKCVEIASREGADAIAHGCTGKGNDQIRLEATAVAIAPQIKIIAPVREWAWGREEEIEYAKKHGIAITQSLDFPYSSDDNMWGVTWECGEIEDFSKVPEVERFLTMNTPERAPDEAEIVELAFDDGLPVSVNGEALKLSALIAKLNLIGARHGIGLCYMVEDRVFGLKVRGVYEHPAAHIILSAHRKLEQLVSSRQEVEFKAGVDQKWGYLCYSAQWHDPLLNDLNAFCDKVNQRVVGAAKVKLYKGKADVVALDSPYALYNQKLATFMADQTFNQNCSAGFIELYGMQMKLSRQIGREGR